MSSPAPSTWPGPVRSLAHRTFRVYFIGQISSHLGKWIQQVALSWLMYQLTSSASLVGIATFAALIPQLLFGPLAGAWADKHDKQQMLKAVLGLLCLQALILAVLTFLQEMTPTLIIVMAVILGILNSLETPLRQAMIGRLIPVKSDLPNGLALNAMLLNGSRFAGPPLAGLLIATAGEAACFAVNCIAFLAPLVTLYLIPVEHSPAVSKPLGAVFREGLEYALTQPGIRLLMLCTVAINITASCYAVLLPALAKQLYLGDAQTLGWLWGAAGIGAFAATIYLSCLSTTERLPGLVLRCGFIAAVGMVAAGLVSNLALCMACLVVVGFAISASNVACNILLQSHAAEVLRGRLVALYVAVRFGFEAIGGLLAGAIAGMLDAASALWIEGCLLALMAVWFYRCREALRFAQNNPVG